MESILSSQSSSSSQSLLLKFSWFCRWSMKSFQACSDSLISSSPSTFLALASQQLLLSRFDPTSSSVWSLSSSKAACCPYLAVTLDEGVKDCLAVWCSCVPSSKKVESSLSLCIRLLQDFCRLFLRTLSLLSSDSSCERSLKPSVLVMVFPLETSTLVNLSWLLRGKECIMEALVSWMLGFFYCGSGDQPSQMELTYCFSMSRWVFMRTYLTAFL